MPLVIRLPVALCALALVLMAPACDDPPDGPPEFNLVVEEQVLPGSKGSYCIEEGGVGMCAEVGKAHPPKDDPDAVPADDLSIELDWHGDDGKAEFSICEGRKNCKNIVQSPTFPVPTDEPWELDLEPGEYVIDAFVTWRSGDASYSWFIEVLDEAN